MPDWLGDLLGAFSLFVLLFVSPWLVAILAALTGG